MRRWILKAGSTESDGLILEQAPIPEPGPGQVRVRVHAASLNYRDQLALTDPTTWRSGTDIIPVADAAGEIDAVGTGVDRWSVGDRIVTLYFDWHGGPPPAGLGFGLGAGGEDGVMADYIVLSADRVTRAPATLDHLQAATLPCAALTAWTALQGSYPVGAGSKVLTLGTGGVSLFAAVLARALGAEVISTTGNDDKRGKLEALGVSEVLNYKDDPGWGTTVFGLGGVDKVVNAAGSGSLNQSIAALRPGGEVATMGLFSFGADPIDIVTMMMRSLSARGVGVGSEEGFAALVATIDRHGVKPTIDRVFAFEDLKDAYQAQVSPDLFGKIVLDFAAGSTDGQAA